MQELAAQRLGEPVDRMLASAISGLQRNAAFAKGRADLNDDAVVARPHPAQSRHGAVHEPQVCHVGDAPEFLRRGLREWGEHRSERHVTHTSIGPKVYSICVAASSTWAKSATSAEIPRATPPPRSTSRMAPFNPAWPRAISPTRSPRWPNSRAAARPMPALAPVMATV
jgi:hypothetical protein